jgi:hypothetical protein
MDARSEPVIAIFTPSRMVRKTFFESVFFSVFGRIPRFRSGMIWSGNGVFLPVAPETNLAQYPLEGNVQTKQACGYNGNVFWISGIALRHFD